MNNNELINLLKTDVKKFNKYRLENKNHKIK